MRSAPTRTVGDRLYNFHWVVPGEAARAMQAWAGGLGGFMLPSVLGAIRDYTGSYAPGLFGCAAVFLCGLILLLELGARWSQRWDVAAAQRAGIYSYRASLTGLDDQSPA